MLSSAGCSSTTLHEEEGREREPARTSCHRLIDSRQACSCLVPFCKWRSCNIPTTDVTANLLMRRPLLLGFPPDFFWCHCRPPNRVADTSDKVTLYEDLFRVGDEEYANGSEAAPKVRWPPQTEKEGFTEKSSQRGGLAESQKEFVVQSISIWHAQGAQQQ